MAKARRSAAQKRATRKLVAFNKRRGKPRSTTRRRSKSSSKPNKRRRRSSNVAKRKSPGKKGSRSFIDKIPILKNKTVQRIGFGLGMGSIAALAAGIIPVPAIQNNRQLIGTGVSFAVDPLSGVVRLALSGGLGQLGNLFGGGGSGGGGQNGGFA